MEGVFWVAGLVQRAGRSEEKGGGVAMTEMRITVPGLEQILENQEKIIQMLSKLMESPTNVRVNEEQLMTGPEVMTYLRCGRKKLNDLIEQGMIERINAFGARPRFKIVKKDDAA